MYLEGFVNQTYGYGDNTFGSDEDGVTFTSLLQSSPTLDTSDTAVVNVQNTAGTARLDAWLDSNVDGDFVDTGEHLFNNVAVVSGDNNLTFTVPAGAASGKTFARFRLSTAGNLAPTGLADDGEVEDYAVLIGGASSLATIQNGTALAPNQMVEGTTDGGITYKSYNATMEADTDDSARALILSLAADFRSSGGSASVLNAAGVRENLELVGNTLLSLIQPNGLTNGHLNPDGTQFQYTLDNFEVLESLRQFSVLERDFFPDPVLAA